VRLCRSRQETETQRVMSLFAASASGLPLSTLAHSPRLLCLAQNSERAHKPSQAQSVH